MKRQIKFEFWRHPLGPGDEFDDAAMVPAGYDEDSEDSEGDGMARPVLATAAGLIPLQPYLNLTEAFNFWMGHTNFSIGDDEIELIENFPGVETLDILTRYRFRVGFGKMFDDVEVRTRLREALASTPSEPLEENPYNCRLTPDMIERVGVVKDGVDSEIPYWALIVLPNGNVDYFRGSDKEVVAERLVFYRELQKAVGGVIFQNANR